MRIGRGGVLSLSIGPTEAKGRDSVVRRLRLHHRAPLPVWGLTAEDIAPHPRAHRQRRRGARLDQLLHC